MTLSGCSSNPGVITATVPEYISVPGPVEYVQIPAELLKPCIQTDDNPVSLGYMQYGMMTGDLLKTVSQVWDQELVPCNNQITQIRKLMHSQPDTESARRETPDVPATP